MRPTQTAQLQRRQFFGYARVFQASHALGFVSKVPLPIREGLREGRVARRFSPPQPLPGGERSFETKLGYTGFVGLEYRPQDDTLMAARRIYEADTWQ